MVRTTKVELRGDKFKAEQLSLAHTNRLLEIFRVNTEFQNLRTNTHTENFFDDSGKFIGAIHMRTDYGIEQVLIDVPLGKKKRKKREIMQDKLVSRIVPCIRSTDNKWWVACLSGTFEGPYYAFENIFDIPPEEMDDNVEAEMDGRMISQGKAPLSAGAEAPQLFFVAQTGVRPELSDYGLTEDQRYEQFNVVKLREDYIATLVPMQVEGCAGGIARATGSFSGEDTFYRAHTVWDSEISPLEQRVFGYTEAFDGPGDKGTAISVSFDSFGGTYTHTYGYYIPTVKGARFEPEEVTNFACCYAKFILTERFDSYEPYVGCEDRNSLTWFEPEPIYKEYWFQVENDKFLFYSTPPVVAWVLQGYFGAWHDFYPGVQCNAGRTYAYENAPPDNNMVKYYGSGSAAKHTGIMCGRITDADVDADTGEVINEICLEFIYNHVGRRSQQEQGSATMSTTRFMPISDAPSAAGIFAHVIPKVIGLPEGVFFAGEIFLGRIEYTTKQKVLLSYDAEV